LAVRPIVRSPDPSLKRPAGPVGDADRAALTRDLVDTMRASPATVGLAAPQIGLALRAFALDVSGHRRATDAHGLVVLFDPVLVEQVGSAVLREGCLSVPVLTADVSRATRIVVRGIDGAGEEVELEMEGFEARAALHELDHLDGKLILDRVRAARDVYARKVYR
jgi:peptide deformylase